MTTSKDARAAFAEGFLGIDAASLSDMPDVELSQWQSGFPSDSAQYILAEREWQRRMISHQLTEQFALDSKLAEGNERAMRFAAFIGVVGTLAGAAVGAFATFKTSSGQTSLQASQPQAQAELGTSKALSKSATAPASSASK